VSLLLPTRKRLRLRSVIQNAMDQGRNAGELASVQPERVLAAAVVNLAKVATELLDLIETLEASRG
jgi:hypothetical protein